MKKTLWKKAAAAILACMMVLALAACGSGSSDAASSGAASSGSGEVTSETYAVSYNLNTNALDMPDYQFVKSNFVMVLYDSRLIVDVTLTLNSDSTYALFTDIYTTDGEARYEVGDGSEIGMTLTTSASGTYTDNGDGTVTIAPAEEISYELATDTYSAELAGVVDISYHDDNSDGTWTLADTPALADMIPATVFTLDQTTGAIVTWARAEGETGTVGAPAGSEADTDAVTEAESAEAAPEEDSAEDTAAEEAAGELDVLLACPSDDEGTLLNLCADGVYEFSFAAYGISDMGSYTYDAESATLTLTNANGDVFVSEPDGDCITLHYESSMSDQLTGDYTILISDLEVL